MTVMAFHSSYALLLLCYLALPVIHSYRIGDAVGIIIRTNKHKQSLEAYRNQMPRFGVSTKTKIDTQFLIDASSSDDVRSETTRKQNQPPPPRNYHHIDDNLKEESLLRLSMSFDEGFHHISWLDVYNPSHNHNNRPSSLETLIIKFVYSASDGSIHSVQQEARYYQRGGDGKNDNYNKMPKSFTVEYIWIEEADVDFESGVFVLFAVVLFVALFGMVDVCCGSSSSSTDAAYGSGGGTRYYASHKKTMTKSSSSNDSSDGFAKRL